jgi:hypothetical protein
MVVNIARFLGEQSVFSFEATFMMLYIKQHVLISYKYASGASTFGVI